MYRSSAGTTDPTPRRRVAPIPRSAAHVAAAIRQASIVPEEIVPIMRVNDGLETAKWYARLGFEVVGEHRFGPRFPLYLFLERGAVHVHLSEHTGDAPPNTLVYLWVDDVDAVAEEFDLEVVEQPWAREVELTDPDGNRLRIATRVEG